MNRVMRALIRKIKYYIYFISAMIVKKKSGNIWLISERGTDARDNGYFFYEWLVKNHPEIEVWYVIDKNSSDYYKFKNKKNIVQVNSFFHFKLFVSATVRISTHAWGGDIPIPDYFKGSLFSKILNKKSVFLQHGITKDFLPGLQYPIIKPDLFICSAEPEYRYIKNKFGHPNGVVQYTGFARFDNLYSYIEKKQILIMPTFRKWLQGITKEEFLESEYFQKWNALLNNEYLKLILEKNKLKLIFYPHYEIQKYIECFNCSNNYIEIADFAHYDVQNLLKESKLLITDFSSVFFDFAYMKKPTIYYQFDRNKYINQHYDFTKGYFDYDSMGFGKVTFEESKLLKIIEECIKDNFLLNDKYIDQVCKFFTIRDSCNCERIFQAIQNIL